MDNLFEPKLMDMVMDYFELVDTMRSLILVNILSFAHNTTIYHLIALSSLYILNNG